MPPVTTANSLASHAVAVQMKSHVAGWVVAGVTIVVLLAACDPPFGLGLPTTRALETGAVDGVNAATSFEIIGAYSDSAAHWTIDLQVVRPLTEHVSVSEGTVNLEAIIIGNSAYFRGREFLSNHLGSDPASRSLVTAAGDSWWKGSASTAPNLADFTDGNRLRATFLDSAVTERIDHVAVGGIAAVELSGPRADVFIGEAAPHQLLRLRLKAGVAIDGIAAGDFRFSNFGKEFGIVAPTGVIDFADLSSLPPSYTVVSVDATRCGSPCVLTANVRNLGGRTGARAPSTITFTLTESASKKVLGSCQAPVQPDVDFNATTTVSCTITGLPGSAYNAATVTATPTNPGRA